MKKKLFAILLAAVMVAVLFPTMASANGGDLTDLSITIKTPTEGMDFDVSPIVVYSPQDSMEIEEVVWYKISANDYKAEAGAENDWKTVSEGEAAQMEYLYMPLIKIKMAQDYCVGQDAELEFNGTKFRGRDFELGQGPRYDIIGSVQDVYVYGPAYKPNHNLVYHEAKAATCTDKGNVEYWHCSVCGKNFTSEACDTEIADLETEKNAANHSGTAVWTQTATIHEQKWDCCNAIIVASEPHEWENGECSECTYACLHSGGTATCTAKAICEICNEEYGDLAPHELTHITAKPATAAEFGNTEYWYCRVCDRYFSDENAENEIEPTDTVIAKIAPKIIAGDGATVTESEKTALSFASDAAFDDFIRVEIDGVTLYEANYTVKEGSTVVTLNADYVATLSVGEHTLGIVSESGTAAAKFTVNKKAEETTAETTTTPSNEAETEKAVKADNKTSPHTGGGNNLALWIALLFVSGGAVTLTMFASKKKRYNK